MPAEHATERNLGRFILLTSEGRDYLRRLLTNASTLKPRRTIFLQGRPLKEFFVVLSGWAVEFRQFPDGSRQITNFRLPGEVMGIESLIFGAALHSAAALTECRIALISRGDYEEIQRRFPRLAAAFLLSRLADDAILQEWTVNLGRRDAFSRIAHVLLELERRQNLHSASDDALLPLSQQDIADCTGLTLPYVNRLLGDMRARGLVDRDNNGLTILNSAALAKAADFQPRYLDVGYQTRWQAEINKHLVGNHLPHGVAAATDKDFGGTSLSGPV